MKLIPKSRRDRFAVVFSILFSPLPFFMVRDGAYVMALIAGSCILALLVVAYLFQDKIAVSADDDKYSTIIERISTIGGQLVELNEFLENERIRVADIEATVRKLNDEKTKLEPVVNTQRETVEAILAAHSARTARQAWKERLLGFVLGVVASLIASFVYEYFKR